MQRDRKPAIREGPQYQAVVPEGPPRPKPTGSEEDDPRSGTRGPTPEEMRAIAAGPEKDAADALPPDARTDNDNIANVNGASAPPVLVAPLLQACGILVLGLLCSFQT
jgi:hypothetical protein